MTKIKKHSGLSKVLKVRKSGTVTIGHPGSRHNTGSKNASFNRGMRKASALSNADARRLKNIIK